MCKKWNCLEEIENEDVFSQLEVVMQYFLLVETTGKDFALKWFPFSILFLYPCDEEEITEKVPRDFLLHMKSEQEKNAHNI